MARQIDISILLNGAVSSTLTNAFRFANSQATRTSQQLHATANSSNRVSSGIGSMITNVMGFNQALELGLKLLNGITKIPEVVDEYASVSARVNLINDGLQTTKELQDMIYKSSQRSRGSYNDMASSVAKLNLLAKDNFKSNKEALYFTELVNKSFTVSGSSTQEKQAGMYQLSQAMAAGKLQGDEFRSIMENAPMIADAISKYLNIPKGTLKELSSEGLITADIIKNSMYYASNDINKMFGEMPVLFGDVATKLKNTAMKNFGPVMDKIINKLNSPEVNAFIENLSGLIGKAADKVLGFSDNFMSVFKFLKPYYASLFNIAKSLFNIIAPVIQKIITKISPLIEIIMPVVINLFNKLNNMIIALTPTLQWLANLIITQVIGAFHATWPVVNNLINILGGVMDFITGVFTGNWSLAWQGVKDVFFNIFKGIGNFLIMELNLGINKINTLIEGVNTMNIPGVKIEKLPTITPFAQGGTVYRPTLGLVGEAGVPETMIPHTNTNRSRGLVAQAAAGVGMSMGGQVNIHYSPVIQGNVGKQDLQDSFEMFKAWFINHNSQERWLSYE